jgi:hypothetical protein
MARERSDEPVDVNEKLAGLMAQLVALQAQAAETEKAKVKENPNYVASSIFLDANGEPWGKTLPHEVYLNSIHLNRTPLTKAEVDALARVRPVVNAKVDKTDGSFAVATVEAKRDAIGRIDRITILMDLKKESNPQHFPKLEVVATQLANAAELVAA